MREYSARFLTLNGSQLELFDLRFINGRRPLLSFAGHTNSYTLRLVRISKSAPLLLVSHKFGRVSPSRHVNQCSSLLPTTDGSERGLYATEHRSSVRPSLISSKMSRRHQIKTYIALRQSSLLILGFSKTHFLPRSLVCRSPKVREVMAVVLTIMVFASGPSVVLGFIGIGWDNTTPASKCKEAEIDCCHCLWYRSQLRNVFVDVGNRVNLLEPKIQQSTNVHNFRKSGPVLVQHTR